MRSESATAVESVCCAAALPHARNKRRATQLMSFEKFIGPPE
jgi:hypothetical protein